MVVVVAAVVAAVVVAVVAVVVAAWLLGGSGGSGAGTKVCDFDQNFHCFQNDDHIKLWTFWPGRGRKQANKENQTSKMGHSCKCCLWLLIAAF